MSTNFKTNRDYIMKDWTETQLIELEDFYSNMEWKEESFQSHKSYPTIKNLDFYFNSIFEERTCKTM